MLGLIDRWKRFPRGADAEAWAGVISGWLRGGAVPQQHLRVCACAVAWEENEQPYPGLMKEVLSVGRRTHPAVVVLLFLVELRGCF